MRGLDPLLQRRTPGEGCCANPWSDGSMVAQLPIRTDSAKYWMVNWRVKVTGKRQVELATGGYCSSIKHAASDLSPQRTAKRMSSCTHPYSMATRTCLSRVH